MPESVLRAYTGALAELGNSASTHTHGQAASERLESARDRIARLLGTQRALVTLTGGGTESINLALKGMYWSAKQTSPERNTLLVAAGEHHATIEAAEWLRDAQGAEVHWLPIDAHGVLAPETLREAIDRIGPERIAVVSFLWANNEVGSIQPVAELTAVAHARGVPVHVDAVAALGQLPIDFDRLGADALSVSAHKIGGPVGVGALLLARKTSIEPLVHGGSQQRARSGTQDVAGAVAFATALEVAYADGFEERIDRVHRLRDRIVEGVRARVTGAVLRGAWPERLPGNAHFTFEGCQGDSLVYLLDEAGISASVGSACQAGVAEVSHVLLAMGLDEHEAIGSLRFTLGFETSDDAVDALLDALPQAVERARAAGLSSSRS